MYERCSLDCTVFLRLKSPGNMAEIYNTVTQRRLNHIAISHAHKHELDNTDVLKLPKGFVGRSEQKRSVFGTL